MKESQEVQAVLDLLRAAVPERKNEIEVLWRKYSPRIEVGEDSSGGTINADKYRIKFDNKTMRAVWLLGFKEWGCIGLYSPAIMISTLFGVTLEDVLKEDEERGSLEFDYRSLATTADSLLKAKNSNDVEWPESVPAPGSPRNEMKSVEGMATFDLVCMATAFVLLHEFRHVMFHADGERPDKPLEEEVMCDVWARAFMTDKIADYVQVSGESHHAVLQKRSMAMALAAVVLHDLTPEFGRWGTKDYPPIADRIHTMVGGKGPSADANYWLFASCLLIGVCRRVGRNLDFVVSDNDVLANKLIELLR